MIGVSVGLTVSLLGRGETRHYLSGIGEEEEEVEYSG